METNMICLKGLKKSLKNLNPAFLNTRYIFQSEKGIVSTCVDAAIGKRFDTYKNTQKISVDVYFGNIPKDTSRKVLITAGMARKTMMYGVDFSAFSNE